MEDIRAEILNRASGVFLWVVLVVRMLNTAYDHGRIHALRRRLSEMPDELDDLFTDILMRDAESRNESILCLQWLLFAQRPLKREELHFAILSGTEPTALGEWDPTEISDQTIDRFILSCSKGLAEVSKAKDRTVQFIHESVRDFFLLRNGLAKLQPDLAVDMAGLSQQRLKQCCNQYIMTDMLEHRFNDTLHSQDLREATEKFPFLEYAVHNIFSHADAAQGFGVSQKDFLREFESPSVKMRKWINLDNVYQRYQIRRYTLEANLLYISAEKNLLNLVHALLDDKVDVDAIGERYGSAIQAASVNGHRRIVQLLIDARANINVVGGEYGDTLTAAIAKNHEAVIKLLLKEGAHQGPVVKPDWMLLANPKVDPNPKGEDCQTPLWWAVKNRHNTVVQLLLANPKVDSNPKDKYNRTQLWWAAKYGHEDVVQLLLANPKVDPDPKDNNGQTPLQWAVKNRHDAVVQLLLADPRVKPDPKGNDGRRPLWWAACNGREVIVQLLLSNPKVDPTPRTTIARRRYSGPLKEQARCCRPAAACGP